MQILASIIDLIVPIIDDVCTKDIEWNDCIHTILHSLLTRNSTMAHSECTTSIEGELCHYFLRYRSEFIAVVNKMIDINPDMKEILLFRLLSDADVADNAYKLSMHIRYAHNISLYKWRKSWFPFWKDMVCFIGTQDAWIVSTICNTQSQRIFKGTFLENLFLNTNKMREHHQDITRTFPTYPVMGCLNVDPRRTFKLRGFSMSIYNILWRQLSTDSIRGAMHWLQVSDLSCIPQRTDRRYLSIANQRVYISDYMMKIKISRDGFVYSNGRCNVASVLTNCSIYGATNSKTFSDIISLCDIEENAFTLHLMMQEHDLTIYDLRVFGIVDVVSGELISVFCANVEDTGSLQKSLGRGDARGPGKYLWSKHGTPIVIDQMDKYHVPICIDAKLCSFDWDLMYAQHLKPLCEDAGIDPYLLPFFIDPHFQSENPHRSTYRSIIKDLKKIYGDFSYVVSDWLRADGIHTFALDGLHLELRIIGHTVKWIAVSALYYYEFISDPDHHDILEANHPDGLRILTVNQCLTHFRKCCRMNFQYNDKNRTNMKLTECMLHHSIK